jgi:hypothetical protein
MGSANQFTRRVIRTERSALILTCRECGFTTVGVKERIQMIEKEHPSRCEGSSPRREASQNRLGEGRGYWVREWTKATLGSPGIGTLRSINRFAVCSEFEQAPVPLKASTPVIAGTERIGG